MAKRKSGGLLGWWSGGKADTKVQPPRPQAKETGLQVRYELGGRFLTIPSTGFFGPYAKSPNGRYVLAWRDGNAEGTVGGARQSGHGRFLLMEDGVILAQGRAERPNDGKVADNGVFIINDWRFNTGELSGTFLAYRADGSRILARPFAANLFNNGLSADGRVAVCQTCNAPNPDGSRLTIFDLALGLETGSCVPESGWASAYEFPADSGLVRLVHDDTGGFAYALDGAFTDRSRWIDSALGRGDIYLVQRLLRDAGDTPSPELLAQLMRGLDQALVPVELDPSHRALALKLRGSCQEALGAKAAALASYDQALVHDPKVGVKRRAELLRKDLSA